MLATHPLYFLLATAAFLSTIYALALHHDIPCDTRSSKVERVPYASSISSFLDRCNQFMSGSRDSFQDTNDQDLGIIRGDVPQVPIRDIVPNPSNICTSPSVRKEWRTLTPLEKMAWISAVKCLMKLPASGKLKPTGIPSESPLNIIPPVNKTSSWYDDFAYVHLDVNTHVHQTGLFFPWHRYFLWSFEQTLKNRCGYTGSSPYWNWSKDAHDFANASIWDPDPQIGLGGFGDATRDHTVPDGAFAGLPLAYPTPHALRREYRPYPFLNLTEPMFTKHRISAASTFTAKEVQKLISGFRGDFKGFQTYFEGAEGMHMSVHFIMGGDISGICPGRPFSECITDATPNEPMFWMHHAMVDKVWRDWQHAHPENYYALGGGTVRDLQTWPRYTTGRPPAVTPEIRLSNDGILFGNYTVGDMFNTTSNGPLCYTYE